MQRRGDLCYIGRKKDSLGFFKEGSEDFVVLDVLDETLCDLPPFKFPRAPH